MWKNDEYKMYLREDTILDFEKIMLSSGECDYLLPMFFIGEDSKQVAYYDCRGFVPLNKYRVERTEDAFFIIEKVILIMGGIVDYLITPSKLLLSTDTIFFNVNTGEIKVAYVPLSEDESNLRRNMLTLIAQLKKDITDCRTDYLDKFAGTVKRNNYRLHDLVNVIGLLRRELYLESNTF